MSLSQDKVNELVDKFYINLTQDPNFSSMFKERNVDVEKLKERQRSFISRLANEDTPQDDVNHVKQVQQRHAFQMSPERSEIWFNIMTRTMDEIGLANEIKDPLLKKIGFLMKTMLNTDK